MEPSAQIPPNANQQLYSFPETPFENIGFSLSGGGFRAAAYGLGVLSVLDHISLEDGSSLLQKVRFVSSASGGTIALAVYTLSLHHSIPFQDFYKHLNQQIAGETLVEKAIAILNDETNWPVGGKSRNIINAFARAYHDTLFSFVPENSRTLGGIMPENSTHPVHIEEFCFNSTDFYTGISFRFQGTDGWNRLKEGVFGNSNIGINWDQKENAVATLRKIRLSDVLAASSCFPMGFEPIIFPKDFSYPGGPSAEALKDSLMLDTLSWDTDRKDEENERSPRARKEKDFTDKKVFGLMDGGICDNQGLYSLLLANDRGKGGLDDHRFDLLMVSDVTSFYMSPYNVPEIATGKEWMKKTPAAYWAYFTGLYKKAKNWVSASLWIGLAIGICFALPLILEGASAAAIVLAIVGSLLLVAGIIIKVKFTSFLKKNKRFSESLEQPTLEDLIRLYMSKDSFAMRTAIKVSNYIQSVQTGVVLQMINARLQSSATMIGEVFLKHIRRLIYDQLFSNPRYTYRRLNNVIYKLTFTNDKNKRLPSFEPREREEKESYDKRKGAFIAAVKESCRLSPDMQTTAELAYGTGTAMWFESEQEAARENNRKAIIATGQFTTAYNLLQYTLGIRHSRHFATLDAPYQERILLIARQLKELMEEFEKTPYYLYEILEKGN